MTEEFDRKYRLETAKHIAVGRLYKLNHSKLPEDCPLRDVKVVRVVKKGHKALLLAYPTIDALKAHFQKPNRMRIPLFPSEHALDLIFVDALYEMMSNAEMMSNMIDNINYWVISKPVADGAESDFKKRMDNLTLAVLAMPGSMLSSFNWTNFDFGSSLTRKVMLQKLKKELETQIGMLTKHKESICQALDMLEAKGEDDIAEISE